MQPGARRAPPLLGERAISRFRCHIVLAAAAPLVLGGCGLPIGIQIASLFADGVSFLATDKTLTDHGISLVANKDCALWRIVKGEEVCREVAPDDILVADAAEVAAFPDGADETGNPEGVPAPSDDFLIAQADEITSLADTADRAVGPEPVSVPSDEILIAEANEIPVLAGEADPGGAPESLPVRLEPAVEIAELTGLETAAGGDVTTEEVPVEAVVDAVAVTVTEPAPSAADVPAIVEAVATEVAVAADSEVLEDAGGTYLIIASYFRSGDAERFARDQESLDTKVLSGTAKGRTVYRVAVGPLASSERKSVKADLVRAGFRDVWALRLRQPDVVVQVAALD